MDAAAGRSRPILLTDCLQMTFQAGADTTAAGMTAQGIGPILVTRPRAR